MSRRRSPSRPALRRVSGGAAAAIALLGLTLAVRPPTGLSGPAAGAQPAFAPGPPTIASEARAAAQEPSTIVEEAASVDRAARRLAEPEAAQRLAETLGVMAQQVADLRDQKLTLGDAASALAVARAARTGVNTVLTLWANERLEWDDVAARLGAPRDRVVGQLRRARQALDAVPAR